VQRFVLRRQSKIMADKIHETEMDAYQACRKYERKLRELKEEIGVQSFSWDSSVPILISAFYKDEHGSVKQYYLK